MKKHRKCRIIALYRIGKKSFNVQKYVFNSAKLY